MRHSAGVVSLCSCGKHDENVTKMSIHERRTGLAYSLGLRPQVECEISENFPALPMRFGERDEDGRKDSRGGLLDSIGTRQCFSSLLVE